MAIAPDGPIQREAAISALVPLAMKQAKDAYDRAVADIEAISRIESGAPATAHLDHRSQSWRWMQMPPMPEAPAPHDVDLSAAVPRRGAPADPSLPEVTAP